MKRGQGTEPSQALSIALKMLRARDRFEAEIRAKCGEKECDEAAVEKAVAFLRSKGMLHDFRLAAHLAERWTEEKCWGPLRVRAELERRDAPAEAIEDALASLPDETETARRFAARAKSQKPETLARRLSAAGFSEECVLSVAGTSPDRLTNQEEGHPSSK
ncbi:MAG: regulatory protein RecX [Armatimonadetes bacterium]|nr:regulatory protein RecX [Armatimonadota bacterium]